MLELDELEFYRAEFILHYFKEYNEKEKKQQEASSDNNNMSSDSMIKSAMRQQGQFMKGKGGFGSGNMKLPKLK